MNSMSGEKLKGIPYSGTLPAVLAGTKAGYLHRYKIYGNLEQTGTPTPENPIEPQECGERTENLWDENYNQDIEKDQIIYVELQVGNGAFTCSTTAPKWEIYPSQYDSLNARFIFLLAGRQSSGAGNTANGVSYGQPRTVNAIDGYITIAYRWSTSTNPQAQPETVKPWEYQTVIVKGSTAPDNYIPYGYKLPLLSGSTPVDIYIGDDTLSTEEYIDSGTGKIYRMVGGVLTPTDPPVPFPQMPTTANSTTISWGGQGLAPSQFDSIQEWVDIPTYKRVNGEWVADN